MDFKKGDEVKWFDDYSFIPNYGTIVKVCRVNVYVTRNWDLSVVKVKKSKLNWD